jgi:hypothetical protein
MSERQLRIISNKISASTNYTSELVAKVVALETKLTELKYNSHYIYSVIGEAEGSFNDPSQILPISFGGGIPSDVGFGLLIPMACYVKHLNISSMFGPNEVENPQLRFQLEIHFNGSLTMTYSYPQPWNSFHTKTSSQDTLLPIQAGSLIYLTCPSSNLIDTSSRHRFSFYFQKNYLS